LSCTEVFYLLTLSCVYVNTSFAYENATGFQYPIAPTDALAQNNNGVGWFVAQDFQDCQTAAVPSGISPCKHLGEDWNYYDGTNYSNAERAIHTAATGYVVASGAKKGLLVISL